MQSFFLGNIVRNIISTLRPPDEALPEELRRQNSGTVKEGFLESNNSRIKFFVFLETSSREAHAHLVERNLLPAILFSQGPYILLQV